MITSMVSDAVPMPAASALYSPLYNAVCALVAAYFYLASQFTAANQSCVPSQNSDYELVFCNIKESAHGRSLPGLQDFRRNPPATQYLLLRKQARKLGIDLKPPSNAEHAQPETVKPRQSNSTSEVMAGDSQERAVRCKTAINSIRCQTKNYRLLSNLANSSVRPQALEPSNPLVFEPLSAAANEDQFLLDAYVLYLKKMISIGLAGSTFSYSAFAYTYYEHHRNGTDFAKRFQAMFEFLKKDKKTNAVSRRAPRRSPRWTECERLNRELIVCYSQGMNLVYQISD